MGIFRTDPADSLKTAQAALTQAEQRISQLATERAAKLDGADGDYVNEVTKLDRDLATLEANASIYRDRIAVMEQHRLEHERTRREQQRQAGITEIKKLLPRRQTAAERLDAALKQVTDAFAALEVADEAVFANWNELLPEAHRLGYLRALRLDWLSPQRKQRWSAGAIREIVNRFPFGLGAAVEERNRELIAELEGAAVADLEREVA